MDLLESITLLSSRIPRPLYSPSETVRLDGAVRGPLADEWLHRSEHRPPARPACLWHYSDLDIREFCIRLQNVLLATPHAYSPHIIPCIYRRTRTLPSLPSPVASRLSSLRFTAKPASSLQARYNQKTAAPFSVFAIHPLRAPAPIWLITLAAPDDRISRDEAPLVRLAPAFGRTGTARHSCKHMTRLMAHRLASTRHTYAQRETYVRCLSLSRRSDAQPARTNVLRFSPFPRGRATHALVSTARAFENMGRIDSRDCGNPHDLGILRNHASERPIRRRRTICVY